MDPWSCLSAFARDLVCGAVNQLKYPCCFNGFVKDLEEEQAKLNVTKESVDKRVEHANKNAKKTDQVIHAWLEREANPLQDSVEKLLEDARTNKCSSCCFGRFPNWIWRYRVARELAKKKKEVEVCNDHGKPYIQLERVATLPADTQQHLPRENCMEFESRQGAYGQLMEALKDDEVTMFGIWGMGGSGKTTMAMKLKRTAESEKLFDKVLFVPVSSNVVVRTIQDKIASALQFPFPPKDGEPERALRLCQRLIDEKRTLVILDDVWQRLDFGAIGIPSSSKVLITTRSSRVCALMGCQRMPNLSTLTDEEAWALFQQQAAPISDDDTLNKLGRQISDECKGLPVAIAALAGTLKGKPEDDWQVALDRLKSCHPVNIEQGLQNPYKCLEVSYENLGTDEVAKSLLLLCSVFPEDYEIEVETLTIYAIGLGLVGREVGSFGAARNEVGAAKNKLVTSSLLSLSVDLYGRDYVKMHDLIRDVALWIAREEKKEIKCVLEKDESWESRSPIRYLWGNEVVPNDLDCSCLEFLRLQIGRREVSDEIFKGMEGLRVLHLEHDMSSYDSLPLTMSFLKSLRNLRCLVLSRWTFGDMSCLGDLTRLESLILDRCSFSELPDVVATQLTNLKLLRLTRCNMDTHPFTVIGRQHLGLEELYYNQSICDVEFAKTFSVPQTLRRYAIKFGFLSEYVGFDRGGTMMKNSQRRLLLSCFHTSNAAIVELAKKADVLRVENIVGGAARNIIPDIFRIERGEGSMCMDYGWVDLYLRGPEHIVCLVDSSHDDHYSREVAMVFFSKLRWLWIQYMDHLEALYCGVPPCGLFEKLEKLHIESCPALTYLLTPATARSLVQLQELYISACGGLKHVLLEEDDDDGDDDKLMFPKLRSLVIQHCSKLELIIPFTFAQGLVQLESLEISVCDSLEYVFGQGVHVDVGDNSRHQNALTIDLPILQHFKLLRNPKLISISPQHCSALFPSLQVFQLYNYPRFDIMRVNSFKGNSGKIQEEARANEEETFHHSWVQLVLESLKVESIFSLSGFEMGRVSSRLQSMNLRDLDEMKYICVGGLKNSFTFQRLERLEICRCSKLEVMFPAAVVRCLPMLKHLEISECQELKQIIIEEEEDENKKSSSSNNNNNNIVSPQTCCFPKLETLYIENCNNLRRLFRTFSDACIDLPSLANFIIDGATELEELIGGGKVKEVELPKLQYLVLINLSSLCQGIIELSTITFRLIHNCPKLSLTSSFSTPVEVERKISELVTGLQRSGLYFFNSRNIILKVREILLESNEGIITREDSEVENPNEDSLSSTSDHVFTTTLSLLNVEESKKKFSGQVPDLNIPYVPSSPIDDDDSELIEYPTTTEILPLSIESPETSTNREVPPLPAFGLELTTPLHNMPSRNLVEQESALEPSLLDQRHHELGETISVEDEIEESVQEDYTSEDTREAATPADIEGNGLGAVVVTNQTKAENSESHKMQNEIGGVCKGGSDVQPDNSSSHLAIVAELEAFKFKHHVDMDDAHIALLAEVIEVYPHLWEVLAKFSHRFQAWMLVTLADMLFFLRNESMASVTPQRLEKFQKLCDEAVQLGFDKPWVDEMRERVKVRDHGVDHAETTLSELLKRDDELTQELCRVKDEIGKLRNLVDSQKKCFDFL